MVTLMKAGLKLWRGVAGSDSQVEHAMRGYYKAARSRLEREVVGENYVLFWGRAPAERRVGIYLKGSCHLRTVFGCKAAIQRAFDGSCCILNEGEIAGARTDFILQATRELPRERLGEIVTRLRIPAQYFRPLLFEPQFGARGLNGEEVFPKSVIFFSTASDLVRSAYRDRESGILVDPGGWWLNQPMERVLGDMDAVTWFRDNFESVGRLDVETFAANFEAILGRLRQRTGAKIVVFNSPVVEPGKPVHNFQFVRDPLVRRTREFNVALAELSRRLDFPIVDVDRILKKLGVGGQKDFAHFSVEHIPAVSAEAHGVMRDLGVV